MRDLPANFIRRHTTEVSALPMTEPEQLVKTTTMKTLRAQSILLALLLASFCATASAQSEEDHIRSTLQKYLDGTSYNKPDLIADAFYEDADLFLSKEGQEIFLMSVEDYASLFEKRERGTYNGRKGTILEVDRANDIALAKAEIVIESNGSRYVDIFLLKRLGGTWKIISKAATLDPLK